MSYICFGDIEIHDAQSPHGVGTSEAVPSAAAKLEITAKVWTRRLLAELTGLTEPRLIEWAVLLGNDYTAHVDRTAYGEDVAKLLGDEQDADELRRWILERDGDFVLRSADGAVQRAINFCFDLYENRDISCYPADYGGASADDSPSDHGPVSAVLRSATDVGAAALAATVPTVVPHGAAPVCRHYAPAVEKMLSGQRTHTVPQQLRWDDICFGRTFQRNCARQLSGADATHAVSPSSLYHGPSFHAFAQQARSENRSVCAAPHDDVRSSESRKTMYANYFLDSERHVQTTGPRAGASAVPRIAHDLNGHVSTPPALAELIARRPHAARTVDSVSNPFDVLPAFAETEVSTPATKSVSEPAGLPAHDDGILPIDAHRQQIIDHIQSHRVTIIQGETGCGKSSRLPQMLLEEDQNVRMMVAQPRRIAAHALFERARACLGPGKQDLVGVRMGHGVKTETESTRMWYVTTGYLVRLCAHHPEAFQSHSHLIIDEGAMRCCNARANLSISRPSHAISFICVWL
eukprot:SAG31_NODE_3787_length_3882_cov_1.231827_2_plen_520_part_00